MSFDTSNIPCSTQLSVHNSEKSGCIGNSNGIVETLTVDNQLLKIFVLSNKEFQLNICAILQDVNANFCIDKIEEFMNTIDYDCIKTRPNAIFNENLKFDVLIYGYSKRGNSAIDLELLVDEQYSETEESKQAVCTVSRQLMESINTVIKSSPETSFMFCIECRMRMWNETDCRQHATDQHKWTLSDEQWGKTGSNAVILQAQYENDIECIVNRFTNVDWLEKQCTSSIPFLIPNLDHMNYRRDVDQSQSSPSLSILPSWTTATSPCTTMCAHCDMVFASTIELEDHTRMSHQGSNISSNRCTNRSIATTTREYRCNICNYKTVTKGNLHIHFQSEKHRNNQREHDQNENKSHIHNQDPSPLPALGSLPQLHILDSLISRAQNDFFSNIKVNSFPSNWPAIHNNDQTKESSNIGLPIEAGLSNMPIFKCEICHNYSHSDIEIILDHAERPRPLPSNSEVSKVVRASMDGSSGAELEHVCMLDGYKTRIKANFLLHFKTEKHQQKLQLLAHAGEGGIENANKVMLQMVTEQTSLISIHCSLCRATFSTAHKLRLHVDSSDHQINQKIANSFHIWKKSLEANNNYKDDKVITGFECKPCGSIFRRYIEVLDHFHLQKNSIHMAVFKQEMDINSLVKVHYYNKFEKSEIFNGSNADKLTIEKSELPTVPLFRCNLCNDPVDRKELRNHLKEIHKIQDHCVEQLINLAEKAHVESISKMLPVFKSLKITDKPKEWSDCVIIKETDNLEPMVRCQQCGKCFATVSLLEEHRTLVKHNDILDHRGHLCYKKGCNQYFKSISLMIDHFYEIHAFQIPEYKRLESFKYVCKICHILAFNCTVKCHQHMNSHSLFGEFECVFCGLTTDGRGALRSHIENYHVICDDLSLNDNKTSPEVIPVNELMNSSSSIATRNECPSTFSSPESIVNKENRNQLMMKSEDPNLSLRNNVPLNAEILSTRMNSLTSISQLISSVGLENVKLVIETMINSKCDQNENDSLVWKYAESIIDVANIKETLVEKCRECGKLFSSPAVLKKHDRICSNPSSEILHEFERIVSVCRDHLTRMMLTYSNDPTRKPLFITINSHANETFRDETVPLQAQQIRPNITCDDSVSHFASKFPAAGLLNMTRPMMQPMMNPYRFHPNNHSFLNILPPLGMFPMPQFRFRNLNSPNGGPTNLSFFNTKPPISNTAVNTSNIVEHPKFSDPSQKIDNYNRKRTQIKNHQYDILRSYFNINNPPNDETIAEIIEKTGLDKKTVKHWFRNTLFKERQRCKDSPYNFNIPPETSLNIEEYEKTGKIEVRSECSRTSSPIEKLKSCEDTKTDASSDDFKPDGNKRHGDELSTETLATKFRKTIDNKEELLESKIETQTNNGDVREKFSLNHNYEKLEEKAMININSIIKDKNSIINKKEPTIITCSPHNDDVPLDLSYQSSGFSILNGSRNSFTFDPISPFESEQEPIENCSSNCGERRHRTTLTAMQIQAMKSIFIHCRSPSHNELGILGNVLSLDMRVVQVWFQNQRAKLKKQERDMFYREKPVFPEATPSIIELPKCDRIHCLVCNQNLNPGISKQAHLFSNDHLIILMRYLVTKSNDMKLNWKSESNSL